MSPDKNVPPSVTDVLKSALRKEQAAYRFYDEALRGTKVEAIRSLLEQLRDEEGRHVRLVQKRLERLWLS